MTGRGAAGQGRGTIRIGLTGPIGCGKSTIAGWLAEAGGVAIDADRLAREVTAPGASSLPRIRERFGDGVFGPDGSLDRGALAEHVFADPTALADLEAIVHPLVRERLVAEVAAAEAAGAPIVAIEAIKLVEAGYAAECDEVWLVVCEEATQRARLIGRGADPADAERRTAAQGPDLVERLTPAATRTISTDGPVEETRGRVRAALEAALEAALARTSPRLRPRER
jgi:dephospho-CoA kinase